MANNIVDTELQELEKEMQQLELETARRQAVLACSNLMNKYQFYHLRGMRTEETHLFALKTPGTCVEMLWGIYDGPEGVLRWKSMEGYGKPRKETKGLFPLYLMTTPIIEVAKDGKTAKGLWLMYGARTFKPVQEDESKINWVAGQFAMDFIQEDGEWKIWKYNTTGLIYSPFKVGWHKENKIPDEMLKELPDQYKPDRPASYPWMWNPKEKFQNIPPVPLPYETWDDSLACVPVPGRSWDIKKD
jgi:hypothetical protein